MNIMTEFGPKILAGYMGTGADVHAPVVYIERPDYPEDQIRSIGDLVVGSTVWRVHPGSYSSSDRDNNRRAHAVPHNAADNYPTITAQDVRRARWNHRLAVGPPDITWYDRPYLEKIRIIATGVRMRRESGITHTKRLVYVPDPNSFYAEGEGQDKEGGPQSWGGITPLSLTAEDVGMAPYKTSNGEERWSTTYLRPVRPGDTQNDIIRSIRMTPEAIVRHIPNTEFLS